MHSRSSNPNADLRAYAPPTLAAFSEGHFRLVRHHLRQALQAVRYGDLHWAYWHLGRADAGVTVAYDTDHPRAYGALCALGRVRKALDAAKAKEDIC